MKFFSLIQSGDIHLAKKKKVIPQEDFSELLEAKEVIEKAQTDADALLKKTKAKCKDLRKKAKEEGLQEGLESFNQQILYMNQQIKQLRIEMQQQILPLALKAAKKIVGEEIQTNSETIVNIVQQTIRSVTSSHHVKIFVNKADVETLEAHKDELKHNFERLESLSIEDRSDIDMGSCVIETEVGIINATLDNQWRALEAAFEAYAKQSQ